MLIRILDFITPAKETGLIQARLVNACSFGSKEVVEIIIRNSKSNDFDLIAKDINGETGIQLAKKYGYSSIVDIIKAERPDMDCPLIGEASVPTTYINIRSDIQSVFRYVVE